MIDKTPEVGDYVMHNGSVWVVANVDVDCELEQVITRTGKLSRRGIPFVMRLNPVWNNSICVLTREDFDDIVYDAQQKYLQQVRVSDAMCAYCFGGGYDPWKEIPCP